MNKRRSCSFLALPLVLLWGEGLAADFVEPLLTEAIVLAKQTADEAFEAEGYQDAYRIYLQELAPIGDKYAQYMVGWMHLEGLGVERDAVRGAAWLHLAAERSDPQIAKLRDQVFSQLAADAQEQARVQAETLRARYGDCTVTRALLAQEEEVLEPRTGSRLPPMESSMVLVVYGSRTVNKIDQRVVKKTAGLRRQYIRHHCREP